jgi:hypothetical protein
MGHFARLLFTIYVTIGKTHYLEMLLHCTQLDYASIRSYVHKQT